MISKVFEHYPRCASKNILWYDEDYLKYQACQLTYYHIQAATVCIIGRHENKILLTTRKKDPTQNSCLSHRRLQRPHRKKLHKQL
ncbi:MAG: hypothetical protein ABI045_00530 [Flavobacteriales bacterium]